MSKSFRSQYARDRKSCPSSTHPSHDLPDSASLLYNRSPLRPTLPEHHMQSSYSDEIAQRLFPKLQFPLFLHLFPPFIALA